MGKYIEWNDVVNEVVEGAMMFWNVEESVDVTISKLERMKTRLVLMADGVIGHV